MDFEWLKQDGCYNLAAILFLAFKNRTNWSGFPMVKTSLDRFIKKRVIKKYFIHDKMV
jgi:hypothetical protein